MINFEAYVVRNGQGVIDSDATVAKFEADLQQVIAAMEDGVSAAGRAIEAVFDDWRGKILVKPTLITFALNKLNVAPELHKTTTANCEEYIRRNSGEGGTLKVARGKGGGVSRIADQPKAAQ